MRGRSIALVVMDGLGGLPHPLTGLTELECARTPHMDALAARSSLGMTVMVREGITPGSGPGHLSLFGYDPTRYVIGRGALSALGVGIELNPGDVAVRLNLATLDGEGVVTDRRAGRPTDTDAARVVELVQGALRVPEGIAVTLVPEKEHRVVLQGLGPAGAVDLAVGVVTVEEGIAVVVDRVIADFVGTGVDRGVFVVAVAVVDGDTVTVDIGGLAVVVVGRAVVVVVAGAVVVVAALKRASDETETEDAQE